MKSPVLILGAGTRAAVTIARSLNRHGIPVFVSPVNDYQASIPSRAIERFIRLPDHRRAPQDFTIALSELVRVEGVDMVIPNADSAMALLGEQYDMLSGLLHVACPPPHIMNRVLDKSRTLEVARRCGIPVPATALVQEVAELEVLSEKIGYPLVAKPAVKTGANTYKVRYFHNRSELQGSFERQRDSWVGALIQEYCPGVGVGIGTIMRRGDPVAVFQHRRLRELPYTGGVSVLSVSEAPNPVLRDAAILLLRALDWEGVAMIEFRFDPHAGSYHLMEVNGRYWGSLSTASRAGVDFPYYEWQLAHGEEPNVPESYRLGVRVRWFTGDLLRLHGILIDSDPQGIDEPSPWKEIMRFVTDFRFSNRGAVWSGKDPLPALYELTLTVWELMRKDIKKLMGRALPSRLVDLIRDYRCLDSQSGRTFLRMRFRDLLGSRRSPDRANPGELTTILFVCLGNIIRSPMAAELLRRSLPQGLVEAMSIESAGLLEGLSTAKPHRPPDRAKTVAKEFGISLDEHQGQPVTRELVERADLILVMDYRNEAMLLSTYPQALHKVFLLSSFLSKGASKEVTILDPYHGDLGDIRHCYEAIQASVQRLALFLSSR